MRTGIQTIGLALAASLLGCNRDAWPSLPETVVIEGRLVNADGSAAPSREVILSRCGPTPSPDGYQTDTHNLAGNEVARVSTDSQGRYRLEAPGTRLTGRGWPYSICATVLGPKESDGKCAGAWIDDSSGQGQFSLPDLRLDPDLEATLVGRDLAVSWHIDGAGWTTISNLVTVETDEGVAWKHFDRAVNQDDIQPVSLLGSVLEDFSHPRIQAFATERLPDSPWLTLFHRSQWKAVDSGEVSGSRGATCAPVPAGPCPLTDGELVTTYWGAEPVVLTLPAPLEARYAMVRGIEVGQGQEYEFLIEASSDGDSYTAVGTVRGTQPYLTITLSTAFAAGYYRLTATVGSLSVSEVSLFP